MKYLIPLMFLGLAACDSVLEHQHPRQQFAIEHEGTVYDVSAQFDAIQRGWFARIAAPLGERLEKSDRAQVFAVFERKLGPKVCDGDPLEVRPGRIWSGFGAEKIRYLHDLGQWQIVGHCA